MSSQFQNRLPPSQAIPGHLTRVKLGTMGNFSQNEARLVGHLTVVSKRLSEGLKRQKRLGKEKSKRKKMTLCLYKRANFADVLKCLRYQEIQEMINRHIFKYIVYNMVTVLLEHLRAF